jgi:Holliday junction DNA helicase RuvA
MIARIHGKVLHKTTESVIVDVSGVGYELFIPLSTYSNISENDGPVTLHVYTHVKEDALHLYGFSTAEEKAVFSLLIGVSGVGPKLARNILSGIAVTELAVALADGDKARLHSIPGIGAKMADRLILELKEKVGALRMGGAVSAPTRADTVTDDVLSALKNLGYKPSQAEGGVKGAKEGLGASFDFELLLKESLRALSKR